MALPKRALDALRVHKGDRVGHPVSQQCGTCKDSDTGNPAVDERAQFGFTKSRQIACHHQKNRGMQGRRHLRDKNAEQSFGRPKCQPHEIPGQPMRVQKRREFACELSSIGVDRRDFGFGRDICLIPAEAGQQSRRARRVHQFGRRASRFKGLFEAPQDPGARLICHKRPCRKHLHRTPLLCWTARHLTARKDQSRRRVIDDRQPVADNCPVGRLPPVLMKARTGLVRVRYCARL